ncbi:alpha-galactosidase [Arcticibacterium luteifluviistationis]|uniref:Alpha-galactosidase n=1 Tax=Arcticibacterium luteifluviistationis TaxID=1784714 RepID=A0A2Z4GB77_9BACT|nr:alpha-galactosidase [Arcticibacterium luteifluviistationis]AWV98290.1 alpha-galactosidase [Arcticibacterium luteifluviistationis]
MKYLLFLLLPLFSIAQSDVDWLVSPTEEKAEIIVSKNNIVLRNGLLSRTINVAKNVSTTSFKNLKTGDEYIRSLRPEARIEIDGKTYNVGGLYGQKEHGYFLEEWLSGLSSSQNDFQYVNYTIDELSKPFATKSTNWTSDDSQATGKELTLYFDAPVSDLKDIKVAIHYAIYDGIPLISKWLTMENVGEKSIKIDQVVSEILATVEEESAVVGTPEQMKTPQKLYIENNFAYNNAMKYRLSDQATHWKVDSAYTSQVNYALTTPCVAEIYPSLGVGIDLKTKETYTSIRSYELLHDTYDKERQGLAVRKMYRTIAPWTNQNPIFMHLISTDDKKVREVIDQCAATGYEMVILSFGSGLSMEDASGKNIAKFKKLVDYAHSKGIKLGGYSLFSSRSIDDENDVIDPVTGLPNTAATFGHAPCLASEWGLNYLASIKKFIVETGFDLLEHDGPYPGDVCASTSHPGHEGLHDSQWVQMELQKELYQFLNAKGVYINAPDWYFLDGSHKIALGYREVNFSLSREQQKILNRQNIYDGTWEKTPSMGWGFVPLTKYQGGGPEAVLEPLAEHLTDYKQLMMQYYGAGIQACYRGPRLYDTEETKAVVKETIAWYKNYREILNSDIIHLRRADGRDWDGIMHVNSQLTPKGLVMLYNPLPAAIERNINIPLYYTGLVDNANVRLNGGEATFHALNRDYSIDYQVTIPANGYVWLLIE